MDKDKCVSIVSLAIRHPEGTLHFTSAMRAITFHRRHFHTIKRVHCWFIVTAGSVIGRH